MPPPPPWPTLPPEALYGLAGQVVRTVEPETESDPVAILGQLLVAFGNAVGRGPHFPVEGDSHHTNLFLCLVGESSRGRKGTSRGRVRQLMSYADDTWCQKCVASGLSSGEGLIWAVRDAIEKKEPIKKEGRVTGYQTVVVDEGVSDKRLLADESEFAQVLRVMQREGNSLSPVIRQSWDTGDLRSLTKNHPARATGAHVSIAAHITRSELAKHLKDTEALNGFANRFLWLCVRRSRLLPDGGRALDLSPLGTRLNYALAAARNAGPMTRSPTASTLWRGLYPQLTAERGGLYGAVTGRAEAQVLRLSMVYALLDGRGIIEVDHLRAAVALWSYADASARLIFGAEPEDPLLSLMLAKLQGAGPVGMTRTDLHNAFSRNVPAASLLAALAKLRDRGDAYPQRVKTGKAGAPAERWFARRRNELNETNPPPDPAPPSPGIDSFNSFLRSPAPGASEGGKEVLSRKKGVPKDADRAADWLKEFLAARPVESDECVAAGNRALGLSRTRKWWRDAVLKPLLGGKPQRAGFGAEGQWFFTLPSHPWPFPGLGDAGGAEEPPAILPGPFRAIESRKEGTSPHPDSLAPLDSMDSMESPPPSETNAPIESKESIEPKNLGSEGTGSKADSMREPPHDVDVLDLGGD
jgi:hypothetical protein